MLGAFSVRRTFENFTQSEVFKKFRRYYSPILGKIRIFRNRGINIFGEIERNKNIKQDTSKMRISARERILTEVYFSMMVHYYRHFASAIGKKRIPF